MATYLDIEKWHRRPIFNFFKDYDNPFFNVCAQVDVTALLELTREAQGLSFTLAYHFIILKVVNELESFRYRLRDGRVLVHERIHAGTTVLLDDGRFRFCYFDYDEDFGRFQESGSSAIEQARTAPDSVGMGEDGRDDLIHCSVLPWVSFTSVTHARRWGTEDSIPKVSFGKHYEDGGRFKMPLSVEVHHALVDGLDVGHYFERVAACFSNPSGLLRH
jgi:chloramphenicol O-acetyltransferase type A